MFSLYRKNKIAPHLYDESAVSLKPDPRQTVFPSLLSSAAVPFGFCSSGSEKPCKTVLINTASSIFNSIFSKAQRALTLFKRKPYAQLCL